MIINIKYNFIIAPTSLQPSSTAIPSHIINQKPNPKFKSRIPRLSNQRHPLEPISNRYTPYFISNFQDIKELNETSNNKQDVHYHFHYYFK